MRLLALLTVWLLTLATWIPAEVRSPENQVPAYGLDGLRLVGRPTVGGDVLAFASRHQREVWTLDIADIQHPRLKRHYSLTGNPGACGFWRDRVVIPAGYQGLLVERQTPH